MTRGGEAFVCGGGSVAHQRRDVAQQGARARANTYYYTVSCPFDGGGGGGVSQRTRRELAMTLVHAVHRVRTLGRGATSNRRGGTTACAGVVVLRPDVDHGRLAQLDSKTETTTTAPDV